MANDKDSAVRQHSIWSSHAARMRDAAKGPTQNDIIQTALVKDRLAALRAQEASNAGR